MVLLIAGFVLAKPFLIMWSIVVSVLSALFLVIGAFLRRHELFPGGGAAQAPPPGPQSGQVPPVVRPVPQQGLSPLQQGSAGAPPAPRPHPPYQTVPQQTATVPGLARPRPPALSGPQAGISPDALVLVIPGRKRYHVAGCRQLAGREQEELTYEEAREEGFTPCTTCLPDAALGGRQLPPDPEPAGRDPYAEARPGDTVSPDTRRSPTTDAHRGESPSGDARRSETPVADARRSEAPVADAPPVPVRSGEMPPSEGSSEADMDDTDPKLADRLRPGFADGPPPSHPYSSSKPGQNSEGQPGSFPVQGAFGAASPLAAPTSSAVASGAESRDLQAPAAEETQRVRPPKTAGERSGSEGSASTSGREADAERLSGGTGSAESGGGWFGRTEASAAEPVDQGSTVPGLVGPPVTSAPSSVAASASSERSEAGREGQSAVTSWSAFKAVSKPDEGTPRGPGTVGGSTSEDASKSEGVSKSEGAPPTATGRAEAGQEADGSLKEQPPKGGAETSAKAASPADATSPGGATSRGDAGSPGEASSPSEASSPGDLRPPGIAGSPGASKSSGGAGSSDAVGTPGTEAAPEGASSEAGAPEGREAASAADASAAKAVEAQAAEAVKGTETFERVKAAGVAKTPDSGKASDLDSGEVSDLAGATERVEAAGARSGEETAPDARTVKVITGTRRYHGAACPLIKGADSGAIQSMTTAEAEANGLTSCSVCQ
ncbi:hypothetical protein [Nonomuraea sp. NPDC046570]|uniref:hypothetical protein n=1 Tax=Nonomuraea sp. NPDC046570 TaxID=3155255 RepID=UPI0033D84E06